MVGHNLTFPSGAGVLQLQHTIKGGSANTGSAVGGTINIIAGDGNASTAPGGEITLKSGQCQNCAGSGANALQGSFGAFGSGIEFWTTKPDNTPNNGRATPAVKITGRGRFLIGITTAGGSFSPNEDAVLMVSSNNAPAAGLAMMQVSTGFAGNSVMFRVAPTSTTFGPGQTKVTMADSDFGLGTSSPIGRLDIATPLNVRGSSYTVRVGTAQISGDYMVAVTTNGHFSLHAGSPTVSACGSAPAGAMIRGYNQAGMVQIGGGAQTACTITFNPPFNLPPICTVSDNSTTVPVDVSAPPTTSAVTFQFGALGGGILYYICIGE